MTDAREHFEERAAIIEHDGCLPRMEAEVSAMCETVERFGWQAAVELRGSRSEARGLSCHVE